MERQMERETVSILQACDKVGVSRRTIYNWINSGKVEYKRTAGGMVRIYVDSLWRPGESSPVPVVAEATTVSPTVG